MKLHDKDLQAKMIKKPVVVYMEKFTIAFISKVVLTIPFLIAFRLMILVHEANLHNHKDVQR